MILTIPNDEYHARPEISNSQLKLIGVSPAHFKAGFSGINPDIARIGTAVHSMILENGKDTICMPVNGPKRQSKDDKKWWCDYFLSELNANIDATTPVGEWFPEIERQTGRTIVTAAENAEIQLMMKSFNANDEAVELLKDTIPELSVIGEINGVPCRTRPDASKKGSIPDLKSCADASPRGFARACASLGYHRQDHMYSQMHYDEYGVWPEFKFIAIGKTKPYPCVVYQLNEEAKDNGAYLVERDLETYKQCLESGEWPCFDNEYDLSIPIYEREEFTYDLGDQELTA